MSLSEIIAELPRLSAEERRELIERALELDDLSDSDLRLIQERVAAHDHDPGSSIPIAELIAELRGQYGV